MGLGDRSCKGALLQGSLCCNSMQILSKVKDFTKLTQTWALCMQGLVWLQLFSRFWGLKDGVTPTCNKHALELDQTLQVTWVHARECAIYAILFILDAQPTQHTFCNGSVKSIELHTHTCAHTHMQTVKDGKERSRFCSSLVPMDEPTFQCK